MSISLFLRGDTTITTISGDNITIFELESRSNIIMGLSTRTIDENVIIKKTPIGITVSNPINKSIFSGIKPVEAVIQ